MWLNCFDAVAGSEEITSVDVAWGPMTDGDASTVLVYQDPNNDGDPSDAVLLTTADTTVANAGTDTFTTVPITPVTVSGKFFVGVLVRDLGANDAPPAIDTDSSAERSWIVGSYTAGGLDTNNLTNNDIPPWLLDDIGLPGNFLVRAHGQSPVDTDYYNVGVQAGDTLTIATTTPAGDSNEFVNTLDPYLELYDPAGTRVAWDDNSAPDSRTRRPRIPRPRAAVT